MREQVCTYVKPSKNDTEERLAGIPIRSLEPLDELESKPEGSPIFSARACTETAH